MLSYISLCFGVDFETEVLKDPLLYKKGNLMIDYNQFFNNSTNKPI